MSEEPIIGDLEEERKTLEKRIEEILEHLRNDTLHSININTYLNYSKIIQKISEIGDSESESLFIYHNKIIQEFIDECFKIIAKVPKNQLIDLVIKQTAKINYLIFMMNTIFTYLDSHYIIDKNKGSLCQNAVGLYKSNYFDIIQNDIYIEVNKLIKDDRNSNNIIFREKIKKILNILNDIDLEKPKIIKENNNIFFISESHSTQKHTPYQDLFFEDYYIKETIEFAKNKGNADIKKMYAQEYIISQLKYLDEENKRQKEYINPKYHSTINEINYKYLIGAHAEELAEKETGIYFMFIDKRNEELKKAFQLFKLYPQSLEFIKNYFLPYILQRGENILENESVSRDHKKLIPELINLNKEMENLVVTCFENSDDFQYIKNKAFHNIMFKPIYPKQLVKYIHYCMKKGFKGKSQEEIDNSLNDIINLYKYLNSKLTFLIAAIRKLNDRLIMNFSLSLDAEKRLTLKLKKESNFECIEQMMALIDDVKKSNEELEEYKLSASKGSPNGIDFNVLAITLNFWKFDIKKMKKVKIPKFLSSCIEDFENFYLKKNTGRKLRWCLGYSKLNIQFLYLQDKNISVSTLIQYLILIYLEKYGTLSIKKLSLLLECPISEVLNEIYGLVFHPSYNPDEDIKKGVIIGSCNEEAKDFKENDNISINKNFSVSIQKFITLPHGLRIVREKESEEKEITKRLENTIIQATIVRILKSRIGLKTTNDWLINETIKKIDLFRAKPGQIKENIGTLLYKNIIRRSKESVACYEYIP